MKKRRPQPAPERGARPVFDAIRKPSAPPGHPLSRAKPEERAHPAGRKAKHKPPAGDSGADESAA